MDHSLADVSLFLQLAFRGQTVAHAKLAREDLLFNFLDEQRLASRNFNHTDLHIPLLGPTTSRTPSFCILFRHIAASSLDDCAMQNQVYTNLHKNARKLWAIIIQQ